MSEREAMHYDVVVVGGGPAGLSAAIRLKQLAAKAGRELGVCVLEKGSEIGAHILSGAVLDTKALDELIPDWKDKGSPLTVPVTENHHWLLTAKRKWAMPEMLLPPFMRNKGTYTLSLGNFCRWLAGQAEELGVEIFPGFAAAEILFNDDGSVKGVATGDMGVARDGSHRADHQPGIELHARYTFFAEGARGHLTKELTRIFDLRKDSGPQVFGLGVKELWDVPADKHKPGRVIHTQGWPLDDAWGGGFLYHQDNGQVALGLRRRARLFEPVSFAVRGDAAVEDPSGDPRRDRGRPPRLLRRPGDQRGRLPGDPQASVPRRGAGRLLGRLRQRAADQGHAHGDEIGDARRRSRFRGGRGRPVGRSARRLSGRLALELGRQGAQAGAQRPAGGVALGRDHGLALCGARHVARPSRPGAAVDA